jgi:hypothetical protein
MSAEADDAVALSFRHPFNLRHVIVRYGARFAVIPRNGHFTPRRCDNRAKVCGRCSPTDSVADFEQSGLFAGHFFTNSTRSMWVWPVRLSWPSSQLIVTYLD